MLSRWSIQLKYSLIFILTLVLIVAGLFIGIYTLKTNQLRNEAMASAEQVLAFRAWVANTHSFTQKSIKQNKINLNCNHKLY